MYYISFWYFWGCLDSHILHTWDFCHAYARCIRNVQERIGLSCWSWNFHKTSIWRTWLEYPPCLCSGDYIFLSTVKIVIKISHPIIDFYFVCYYYYYFFAFFALFLFSELRQYLDVYQEKIIVFSFKNEAKIVGCCTFHHLLKHGWSVTPYTLCM